MANYLWKNSHQFTTWEQHKKRTETFEFRGRFFRAGCNVPWSTNFISTVYAQMAKSNFYSVKRLICLMLCGSDTKFWTTEILKLKQRPNETEIRWDYDRYLKELQRGKQEQTHQKSRDRDKSRYSSSLDRSQSALDFTLNRKWIDRKYHSLKLKHYETADKYSWTNMV